MVIKVISQLSYFKTDTHNKQFTHRFNTIFETPTIIINEFSQTNFINTIGAYFYDDLKKSIYFYGSFESGDFENKKV